VAPQTVSNATRRFVITQTVGGVETNAWTGGLLASGFTTDRTARAAALAQAATLKAANPAILYRVYSPSNSGAHTDGDCVWRSDVDYG
jgi:hypothetical protein